MKDTLVQFVAASDIVVGDKILFPHLGRGPVQIVRCIKDAFRGLIVLTTENDTDLGYDPNESVELIITSEEAAFVENVRNLIPSRPLNCRYDVLLRNCLRLD